MKTIYIHILGEASVGRRQNESLEAALERFRLNPLFVPEDSREAAEHGEWALPLTKAARYEIDHLLLVATQQNPRHEKDTWAIAQVLSEDLIARIWQAENRKPPSLGTVVVRDFSVAGFLAETSSSLNGLGVGENDRVVIEMGAGAASAFVGVLLGVLRANLLPTILQVTGDVPHVLDLRALTGGHLDLKRWLVRHRMWRELSGQSGVDEALKTRLVAIGDFESLRRAPDRRRLHQYAYSDIVGRIARGDQSWLPRIQRLVESTWGTLVARLSADTIREVETVLGKHPQRSTAAQLYEAAKSADLQWRKCADLLPEQLVVFWESHGRRFRSQYAVNDHKRLSRQDYRVQEEQAKKQLANFVAAADEALGVDGFKDQIPLGVEEFVSPFTLGKSVALRIRNIGMSENSTIKRAFVRHEVEEKSTVDVEIVPDSDDGVAGFLDIERTMAEVVKTLSSRLRDSEASGRSARSMHVFLNQGSKPMNLSLVCGALVVAFEWGIALNVLELAEQRPTEGESQTIVRPVGAINPSRLMGRLLPLNDVASVATIAIQRLEVELAKKVAEFLPASDRSAVDRVCDFFLGSTGNNRMEKTAKAVARCMLVIQQSPFIGQAEAVVSVSQLLSGNFADSEIEKDQWGQRLPELWRARNQAIHLRFGRGDRVELPSLPASLTLEKLAEAVARPEFDSDRYLREAQRHSNQLLVWFDQAIRSLDSLSAA